MSRRPIPMRVLVIDDDPTIRQVLALLLERENCAVESADSGGAALTLLRRSEFAFDLVLADVQMPGMTVAELAHQLRVACGPATLLLAISGSQPPAQAISLFDGFLLKPFTMNQVVTALRGRRDLSTTLGHLPAAETDIEGYDPQPAKIVRGEGSSVTSVLDETIYRQLASSIPAPQLQEMYALCVDDARKRIAGMRTLAAARDGEKFVREAHSLKGGCGMLGATELHRMAAELETNGLQFSPVGTEREINFLDELSAACDRLERMLSSRV